MSKKRLQKELKQSQKHNQEMKNEIVDIKMQIKRQQKILEALCVSQNISLSDLWRKLFKFFFLMCL